jgi:hypothetical protein
MQILLLIFINQSGEKKTVNNAANDISEELSLSVTCGMFRISSGSHPEKPEQLQIPALKWWCKEHGCDIATLLALFKKNAKYIVLFFYKINNQIVFLQIKDRTNQNRTAVKCMIEYNGC